MSHSSQSSVTRALIIGMRDDGEKRNIGGELCSKLAKMPAWDIAGILTSTRYSIHAEHGVYDPKNHAQFRELLKIVQPQVGFVCIPTRDHGETAMRYIEDLLEAGAIVSTAEKGSISWQAHRTMPKIDRIDVGAAFGGGNRFFYHPKLRHLRGRRVTIYAVLNATGNCALWVLNANGSIDDAVQQCIDRKVAEPLPNGERLTFATLINGELPDKAMKAAGFYNTLLSEPGQYLTPDRLGIAHANDDDIARITNPFDNRRLIMMITNDAREAASDMKQDLVVPLRARMGEWHISVGFRSIGNGAIANWIGSVPDINNGVLLYVDSHRYSFGGPGAGRATVDAMIEGALDKLEIEAQLQGALKAKAHAA